jgi:cytochrome c-type biogenesis protein CcmH/NrfF
VEAAITTIDFRQTVEKIKNFKQLPGNVQEAVKSADHIESKGFQELLGYDKENTLIWSAGGHWDGHENKPDEQFVIQSFGGMKCPQCKNSSIQWSDSKAGGSIEYKGFGIDLAENDDDENYLIYDKAKGNYLGELLDAGQPPAHTV